MNNYHGIVTIKTVKLRTSIDFRVYSSVIGNLLCQTFSNYNWRTVVNLIDAQSDAIDAIYDDSMSIVK